MGGQAVGQRCEFGGVPAEPLHLVDGEQHAAVRGVSLDRAGESEGGLKLGRTRIRVLIFSEKILSHGMPCALSAFS
ncbi:hypothetical protein [Streptomyces sp. NPDC048266]|uniref:hypothetical protein n=1 Tax=Streptomyces sp. NPDC048266 TaxID=3155787 RepID=UPI0033D954C4